MFTSASAVWESLGAPTSITVSMDGEGARPECEEDTLPLNGAPATTFRRTFCVGWDLAVRTLRVDITASLIHDTRIRLYGIQSVVNQTGISPPSGQFGEPSAMLSWKLLSE